MDELKIPPCAAGTWGWGKGMNGAGMIFGKTESVETLRETFETACSLGFALWDTAEVYGMGSAENLLGRFIAEYKRSHGQVLISTKFMPPLRYKEGAASAALEGSLSRLGVSSADIYWLHLPRHTERYMVDFARLLREGKIKAAGVSNHSPEQIAKADKVLRREGFSLKAVQNHFSLIRRDEEQQRAIDWCKKNGVIYFSYMVLEQGALSGKYDASRKFPALSLRGLEYNRKLARLDPLIDYLRELGIKYKVSPAMISTAWAISKGTVPIIGLTKPKYAADLAAASQVVLKPVEISVLETLADRTDLFSKGIWERGGKKN